VAAGTANVKASSGTQFGQVAMTVNTPTSVTVTPNNSSVLIGQTLPFQAVANYSDGFALDVTSAANWSSLPTSVATVDSTGLATGVAKGTATIKASFGLSFGQSTQS